MTSEPGISKRDSEEDSLIADLFHALNQPLSSLHCALELMIGSPSSAETYRDTLIQALAQADQIAEYTAEIRELWEASSAEDVSAISLDELLRKVLEEELPDPRAVKAELVLHAAPFPVLADRQRLRLALRLLIAYGRDSVSADHRLRIGLRKAGSRAELMLHISKQKASGRESSFDAMDVRELQTRERHQNLRLAVVRRLLARRGVLSVRAKEQVTCLRALFPSV
jgi:hypothetical protein